MQRQSLIATCLIICAGVLGGSGCGSKAAPAPAAAPPVAPAATPPAAPQSTPPATPPATPPPGGASSLDLDFVIVNSTGHPIKGLSVGATGTGEWSGEDELLKGRTFANGDAMAVTFNPKARAEKWDIKVTWADGSGGEEWVGLKLTEIAKLTLVYDADNDETSAIVE
jgi:hypothetical protein